MDTQEKISPEENEREEKERRNRRRALNQNGILLIEDELPDRGKIRQFIAKEFGETSVQALGSMEAVIDLLLNPKPEMKPPSIIVLDLFLYFPTIGDMPEEVLDQLMIKYFSVPLTNGRKPTGSAVDSDQIVLGRLGVLSCLVEIVKSFEQAYRPSLILYTQLFKYCKRYDRAFGYTIFEVKHADNREPEIKRSANNSEFRCGPRHKDVLCALSKGIHERILGIESCSAVKLNIVEKPYNFIQDTNRAEFLEEEKKALTDLGEMVEKLLNPV